MLDNVLHRAVLLLLRRKMPLRTLEELCQLLRLIGSQGHGNG
ncbi:MAG: hypothetical protein AB3X44_04765 [Leptothrix sp. (in: b-proteobacteria)]